MTGERYSVVEAGEGFYLHDQLDDIIVGDPFPMKIGAEIAAERMNTRPRVQENVFEAVRRERLRQDRDESRILDSSEHLAIAMKKLGDVASTLNERQPRERNVEQELVELAAVVVRWAEQVDLTR